MARRKSWRVIKCLRSYTVDEASRALQVCKGTVRRWLKAGLPALTDQRPLLIMGDDLIAYLKQSAKPPQKCAPHECYCFKCKAPRGPAFDALEYQPISPTNGQLRALCEVCSTVMNKAASLGSLERIGPEFSIAMKGRHKRLINGTSPPSNDHFTEDE